MTIALTFLGTGTSQGVPIIACDCPVCRSSDPRDRRSRTSALLTLDGRHVLLDASPELRLQCLQCNVRRLDAVLLTHTHADHVFGLDDLRRFTQLQRAPLPVYAPADQMHVLERIFGYACAERAAGNTDLPQLTFHPIDGPFELFGHDLLPLPLPHGRGRVLGYRIGGLAYCTDCTTIPDELASHLAGLDVLVLGALRQQPHPAHLSISQAVTLARRLQPRRCYLTHLSHHVSHALTQADLPDGIFLAHDGLTVQLLPQP